MNLYLSFFTINSSAEKQNQKMLRCMVHWQI